MTNVFGVGGVSESCMHEQCLCGVWTSLLPLNKRQDAAEIDLDLEKKIEY